MPRGARRHGQAAVHGGTVEFVSAERFAQRRPCPGQRMLWRWLLRLMIWARTGSSSGIDETAVRVWPAAAGAARTRTTVAAHARR